MTPTTPKRMWHCLLCSAACLALLPACTNSRRKSPIRELVTDSTRPDVPVVMFHRFPGYTRKPIAGPIVGVWPDGRVVRVSAEDTIGTGYFEGKLSDEQLRALLTHIATHDELLDLDPGEVIVDAPFECMGIRLHGHRVHHAETVGNYPQLQPDPHMASLRNHLMSIEIADPRPAAPPWRVPPDDWYE